jgi:hypothetical protein
VSVRGALAGQELVIPLVGIRRQQGRRAGGGPRDHQRRDVEHVGGEPGRGERLDVLPGRDKDLLPEMPALPVRRQVVLEAHPGRARLDHRRHQFERIWRTAGAGHDRGQPPSRGHDAAAELLGPGKPVRAQQRVADLAHRLGHRARRLAARQVDGLQPGPGQLHRIGRDRTEGRDRVRAVQEAPEPAGAAPGKTVLPRDAGAQPDHVPRGVVARDPGPAGAGLPLVLQAGRLLADRTHADHAFLVTPAAMPGWP